MARSNATTPAAYLKELPADRRREIARVRDMVRKHLPDGYRETMNWGMITYEVPLDRYPDTYNRQPLGYAALASQKRHMSLYLMGPYTNPAAREWLELAYAERGKKLDMGKSCLRFKRLDDLPLDVIGTLVARTPVDEFLRLYEASRNR